MTRIPARYGRLRSWPVRSRAGIPAYACRPNHWREGTRHRGTALTSPAFLRRLRTWARDSTAGRIADRLLLVKGPSGSLRDLDGDDQRSGRDEYACLTS